MTDPCADAIVRENLLRRERMPAVVINMAISIAFFFAIFGWREATTLALAIDFIPQTLGITILGGVVPAMIMRRRIARGAVLPARSAPTLATLLVRIAGCALAALVVGAGAAAALTILLAPPIVPPLAGLLLKAAYGGILGLVMTPPVLRMTLGMRAWRVERSAVAI